MILDICRPEDLSKNLKALRKRYKVSQKELAREIGKDPSMVLRFEKGYSEMSVDTAIRMLQFFIEKHVKDTIILSIKLKHDTTTPQVPIGDSTNVA